MPVISRRTSAFSALLTICVGIASADDPKVPVFKDGEAQIVPEFKDPADWVRHDLWVETEFDSDGDGKLDLVVANGGADSVGIYLGNGSGGFDAPQSFTVGATPYGMVIKDINLDGKPDIVTANYNSNDVSILRNKTQR